MTFRCNDVVVARFPYVEGDRFKPRPSLVLSTLEFNEAHRQVIIAMITTASRSFWPSDVPIGDLDSAGLRLRSVVRWKVFTVSETNFGPKIGVLSASDGERVARARIGLFGDHGIHSRQ